MGTNAPKSPLASITVWVNALTLIATIVAFAINDPTIGATLNQHPEVLKWVITIQAGVNLLLRVFVTKQPTTLNKAA